MFWSSPSSSLPSPSLGAFVNDVNHKQQAATSQDWQARLEATQAPLPRHAFQEGETEVKWREVYFFFLFLVVFPLLLLPILCFLFCSIFSFFLFSVFFFSFSFFPLPLLSSASPFLGHCGARAALQDPLCNPRPARGLPSSLWVGGWRCGHQHCWRGKNRWGVLLERYRRRQQEACKDMKWSRNIFLSISCRHLPFLFNRMLLFSSLFHLFINHLYGCTHELWMLLTVDIRLVAYQSNYRNGSHFQHGWRCPPRDALSSPTRALWLFAAAVCAGMIL